jgi:hypothetical protein
MNAAFPGRFGSQFVANFHAQCHSREMQYLSPRLLSSTTADFGREVIINLPPSRACVRAVFTLDAVCTVLTALFREDKLRNEASVRQAAL